MKNIISTFICKSKTFILLLLISTFCVNIKAQECPEEVTQFINSLQENNQLQGLSVNINGDTNQNKIAFYNDYHDKDENILKLFNDNDFYGAWASQMGDYAVERKDVNYVTLFSSEVFVERVTSFKTEYENNVEFKNAADAEYPQLTFLEKAIIHTYTTNPFYLDVNEQLRDGSINATSNTTNEYYGTYAYLLQKSLSKCLKVNNNIEHYRGAVISKSIAQNYINSFLNSQIITERGFFSTSRIKEVAVDNFLGLYYELQNEGDILVEYNVVSNIGKNGVDIETLSFDGAFMQNSPGGNQREILYMHNANFEITNIRVGKVVLDDQQFFKSGNYDAGLILDDFTNLNTAQTSDKILKITLKEM